MFSTQLVLILQTPNNQLQNNCKRCDKFHNHTKYVDYVFVLLIIYHCFLVTKEYFRVAQEKKTRSTVLNPRRAKEFVAPSTLTRCMVYFALYGANVPGTFFNARHQVKAIAIGVSETNPLVEIGCLLWCVHLHVFLPINPQNRYKGLSLNTHFYIAL